MFHAWKLLPLWVSLVIFGALMVVPGGPAKPHSVHALPCIDATDVGTGTLVVRIFDVSTNELIEVPSTVVLISPNPGTREASLTVVDNTGNDSSPLLGVIQLSGACAGEVYTASLAGTLHPSLAECDILPAPPAQTLAAGAGATLFFTLEIDCKNATWGEPATIVIDLNTTSFACGGAGIATVHVRDAAGINVGLVPVKMQATLGTFNPDTKEMGLNGSNFFFYNAPSNQHGTVVFTATAGDVTETATATIRNEDCVGAMAPPPTSVAGGASPAPTSTPAASGPISVIRPPNTGDAGLLQPAPRIAVPALAVMAAGLAAVPLLRRKQT